MNAPRSALIIAHPGHELRLHHWLERSQPLVFVLTDGSGSAGYSRIPSTTRLLMTIGARSTSVFGAFSDVEIYRAIMSIELQRLVAVTVEIADCLVREEVDFVVADSCEFYNPAHDLCRVVANLAVERARAGRIAEIGNYDYRVIGPPDLGHRDGDQIVSLDDAALKRKIDAAMAYPELKKEVENALRVDELDAFRVEALRLVPVDGDLPLPEGRPYYEQVGEEQVAAGRYATVLRYEEHFVPFVSALSAAVRATARTS